MVHRSGHGTSVRVVAEAHPEIAIHGGGVECSWIAIAECTESLIILGAPGEYRSTIINMSVYNNKYVGIFGTGNFEFPEVAFKLSLV